MPDLANRNRFAFDPGEQCPLHSCYYILLDDPDEALHVTSLLNSKPIEFLVKLTAPVVKDGFRRYRRQFLAQLPIPTLDGSIKRSLVEAATQGDAATINAIAENLFGLSTPDCRLIDEYLDEQASPHAP